MELIINGVSMKKRLVWNSDKEYYSYYGATHIMRRIGMRHCVWRAIAFVNVEIGGKELCNRKRSLVFIFSVQEEEDDVLFEKGKAVFSVMGALIYQMPNLYRQDK
jgi:hypothetical protein